jgi:cyclopropane-fatty-acyl-phospholipid synthase
MSEHVGRAHLDAYFSHLYELLRPGGRLVNQAISALPAAVSPSAARWPGATRFSVTRRSLPRNSFIDRYIFPDGELVEVGLVVSAMQRAGFEVRHVESLREHYGLTLRAWVKNLQNNWDLAVAAVGAARARIWLVYLAASARTFETDRTGIHQVLAVKPDRGRSGMPLRPVFDDTPISRALEVQR